MANPPIPPLFCSTPPPIDDEEDFGEFTNVYQDNALDYIENDMHDEFNDFNSSDPVYFEAKSNLKTTPIPDLFPTISHSIPPNDINCDTKLSMHSGNVESESKLEHHKNNAMSASLSSLSEHQTMSSSETKSLDKVESIKLDEVSNDKQFGDFQFGGINEANKDDSGRSSQSDPLFQDVNETLEKPKYIEPLANVVVLEDVPDDESDDERLSPRNRNNFLYCDADSKDFFALQPVDGKNGADNIDNEDLTIEVKNKQLKSDNEQLKEKLDSVDSIATAEVSSLMEENALAKDELIAGNFESDDEFANFQEFSKSENVQSEWKASFESPVVEESSVRDVQKEGDGFENSGNDDDDDFGDFSVAPIAPTPVQSAATQPTSATSLKPQNLEIHLKSLLELMFPKTATAISDSHVENLKTVTSTKNCLELAFVESAKALDYQWIGSNMRHSLIRSLGIDSRNIFLTEKWNPTMPRFAANLSFDPLQPLKSTSGTLQPEVLSSSNQKPAVPVAEFDWQTSGLVNPLDASHVHTLLLDVDQLVVVANLDIINLDSSSSSYCSQISPSRALTATTKQITATTTTTVGTSIAGNKMQQNTIATATADDCDDCCNGNNGTIFNNAFHGDNHQTTSFITNTADINFNASGTITNTATNALHCGTANIIDLHDSDNVSLLSTTLNNDMFSNNCNIIHTQYHNNNNNKNNKNNNHINTIITNNIANTPHDAFNVIDAMCFDDLTTITTTTFNSTNTTTTATATITASSTNLLLFPTTMSVAFTNHNSQFDNLHHTVTVMSMTAPSTSNPITPPTIMKTTSTIPTTATNNQFNDFTNIAHHFEQMKLSPTTTTFTSPNTMHLNSVHRDSRSKAEMATQSFDASNTQSCASNVIVVNDDGSSNGKSDSHSTNIHDEDASNASSINTTTETPANVASEASTVVPSTVTAIGGIDAGAEFNNNNHEDDSNNENIEVGYLESKDNVQDQPATINVKEFDQITTKANEADIFENKGTSSAQTLETTTILEAENPNNVHFESVSISRSTFAGPLKETHIFTPSKSEQSEDIRTQAVITTQKVTPIDFDYEKAAAGIIIDETVVRKEYRDVEYNPGFSLEVETAINSTTATTTTPTIFASPGDEFDDEFTDFQSVPPPTAQPQQAALQNPKSVATKSLTPAAAATANGMILSPAILLPQAISIENKQPKIEWGDSAASIDPDELARIEQLFPQDKNSSRSESRKSTPTHTKSLSISASIASQEQKSTDDDDWSDFVSAKVTPITARNTHLNFTQQQSPQRNISKRNLQSTNNDDEWSDFVSSTPSVPQNLRASPAAFGLPQFNSGSWQHANFYNNPLSIYHMNAVPNVTPTKSHQQQNNYISPNSSQCNNYNNNKYKQTSNNNSYSSNNNNNFQQQQAQYLSTKHQKSTKPTTAQQLQQQQKVQIMQDFSTSPAVAASIPTSYRPNSMSAQSTNYASGAGAAAPAAFQVGSAKIAPTVSLIPDLGFVAPAMPVHTAIINALPKPSSAAPPRK